MKNLLLTKSAAILIIIGSIILGCKKEVALEEAALKNESVESAVSANLSSKSLLGAKLQVVRNALSQMPIQFMIPTSSLPVWVVSVALVLEP
jgi:hypothetical protein